jgi:hypothetical protein
MIEPIRILTAATLMVHLLVGCCAHHAHACDTHSVQGQCPDHQDDASGHSRHGQEDCQGRKCAFVGAVSLNGHSFAPISQWFVIASLDNRYSLFGGSFEQFFLSTSQQFPSVRLYLMHQVLRI